ncbi:hypothetical protein ATO10_06686 [Actibacterium atlanticum]|uniref:Apple domain-containing protein n=1 Tax=Actibacterium atlanticum TaxID=1461693 RepID=A0A058ZM17_9RHOB|nr:hypothetical protein ATO10_06686 [Actibacterium atlanticum]
MFDTSFQACARACLSDDRCNAFTFNGRSNSCFPKSDAQDRSPYEGALSAIVINTPADVLVQAAERRAELGFLSDRDIVSARDFAVGLANRHYVNDWDLDALLNAAGTAQGQGNLVNAMRFTGSALTFTDAADQWVSYGDLALAIKTNDGSKRRDYQNRALWAAINGYLRGSSAQVRANALELMSRAFEIRGRGRDMIPALRLSQSLAPRTDVQEALERAIEKYGFRVVETNVDNNAAQPRICAQFNEALAPAGVDYTPFVKLTEPGLSVSAEGRQLCVEGLKHGQRYSFTLRQGLPAQSGETLIRDMQLTQYVGDRDPVVRFPGRAYVLPKTGQAALPIVTVNLETVDLTLRRVSDRNLLRAMQDGYFGRPLSAWDQANFGDTIAEELWSGTGAVQMDLNQEVTTRLPMDDAIKGLPAGIYALQASVPGADPYDLPAATQWFVISNLGLATMSGADGLHVFVRALSNAEPASQVKVSLLSRANRVLAETETNSAGYAMFETALTQGRKGAAPALVMVEQGDDTAFLSLTDPEFDLSDRGVEGRPPAGPIDVFASTDRGAYRAGEVIHVTALARDAKAEAIPDVPLTVILRRPDGVEYSRQTAAPVAGGGVFHLPLGGNVPRGTWSLAVLADPDAPPLATQSVLVEDFLPERIDFDLTLPDTPIRLGDVPMLGVAARYLFGAPAGDLPIEGEVTLRAKRELPDFPGFQFGRHDTPFAARTEYFAGDRTDAEGNARIAAALPQVSPFGVPLEATFTARVREGSGRPVERRIRQILSPNAPMIGIKPGFDGVVGEGAEARFDLLALDATAQPMPTQIKWQLSRIETRYQWYQLYGSWNWEPVTTRTRIDSGTADMTQGRLKLSLPVDWGQYELRVEQADGGMAVATSTFYAGWYAAADASSTPDMLEVSLNQPNYAPGDTATLRVVPRSPGKALVTVMSNRLIDMMPVDLVAGENLIDLPVTDEWGAGAYVTATLIQPMDVPAGRNPTRALGLAYAPVDPGARQLTASFEVAPEAAPREPLTVALRVDGVQPGDTAYATIAAVDLGILNLTGFDAPDPSGHYFGQRKLGMGLRDVYGRLIDGMNGAMGQVRSGGDAAKQMQMQAPPPTEDLVAYFTGPIEVDADGLAQATFDLPSFNGTVRLMAIAWSEKGVGQAEADVLVRDPVVVTASLPRFMAPGDTARMLLEITHATGPSGRIGLDVTAEGVALGAVPSGLDLAELGSARVSVPVTAGATGLANISVALTTPDGKQLVKTLTLPVQVNDPEVMQTYRLTLANKDDFSLNSDVFADFLHGTGSATLTLGPLARFDTAGLLQALDRYPYGCTEQVTSRALPLLYLDQVAQAMGLGTRDETATRISQSIDAVLANQASNGGFGLWRAGSGDLWLDAYVSDFLSRAKTRGFDVPQRAFASAMDNLRNQVNYAADFDKGGEDLAYALMVLAREGAAAIGDLRYYADVKGADFATPLATAQLAAALAMYGEQTRADRLFALAARQMGTKVARGESLEWRSDYGTHRRDAAGVLALAAESGSTAIDTATMARFVMQGSAGRSTQEAVWTLLAANALIDRAGQAGFLLDGAPMDGPLVQVLRDGQAGHVLTNGSGKDAQVTLTTFGVPEVAQAQGGTGYAINRAYYTLEGQPAALDQVPVGTRLVAVLEVQPFESSEARLMINDPLPAGFEIDNPNLLRGGDIAALDWISPVSETQNTEFRQERFLAAVDWYSTDPFRLAYILRATTPGEYHHPAASVEDMYRPDRRAWSASSRASVVE